MIVTAIFRHLLIRPIILLTLILPTASWAMCTPSGWNAYFSSGRIGEDGRPTALASSTPEIVTEDFAVGDVIYSMTRPIIMTGYNELYCANDFYFIQGVGTPSGNGIYPTSIPNLGIRMIWEATVPYSGSIQKIPGGRDRPHSLPSIPMTIQLVKTGSLMTGGVLEGRGIQFGSRGPIIAYIYSGTNSNEPFLASLAIYSDLTVNIVSRPRPATCRVSTQNIEVALPKAAFADFKGIGSVTAAGNFNIELTCSGGSRNTRLTAYVTLTDVTHPDNRSDTLSLASNSTAQGMGIQVLRNSAPVNFGADSRSMGNPNQWKAGEVRQGQTTLQIPLSARLIQTASQVVPGVAHGNATFTMSYQ